MKSKGRGRGRGQYKGMAEGGRANSHLMGQLPSHPKERRLPIKWYAAGRPSALSLSLLPFHYQSSTCRMAATKKGWQLQPV